MGSKSKLWIATLALSLGCSCLQATDLASWTAQYRPIFLNRFLKNISPPGTSRGAVIASPSTENPNYYFHWIRDAALSMDLVVTLYDRATDATEKAQYLQLLEDYLKFSRSNQWTVGYSGLGVPRLKVDGSLVGDFWPSPQDDGPALRAVVFTRLANIWLREGHEDWVRSKLYNWEANCVIKPDLEFTSHHWQRTSFDLWEELHGHHFFTRLAQLKALSEGGALAIRLGDYEAGGWYHKQQRDLERELARHWSESQKFILSTLDRDGGPSYKYSNQDASVILAVIFQGNNTGDFSFTDDRVLLTAQKLHQSFQSLYPLNSKGTGTAIGRYPEDRYDGHSPDAQGNPWFLTTAGLSEFFYRAASAFERRGFIQINELNHEFFEWLMPQKGIRRGVYRSGVTFEEAVARLRSQGDSYLDRLRSVTPSTGSLSEQINRNSGFLQGANDLTWSYASLLSAFHYRSH